MGCDGGTIPTRDELVRTKKKPEQKDKTADLAAKWKHCAITQEPLQQPVMACELGRLYNKESVLEFLIDRSKFECAPSFEHLRGLKDVKELTLTENRSYSRPKNEKGDGYTDTQDSRFICPVVGVEMNGMYKFCFLWTCGCVLSDRALKEVKGDNCHKCGKPFTSKDIITLNGTDEDIENLRERMEERRLQQKLEKKAKKAKKQKTDTTAAADGELGPSTSKQMRLNDKDGEAVNGVRDSKLTNGMKESKVTGSKGAEGKSKLVNGKLNGHSDVVKKTGSIQADPKASAAYKSLFTSCDKAKSQAKAHWVTYNPHWN